MGSRPGLPFGLEDKAPLNLLDVSFWRIYKFLHIPTNKRLEVRTQYRLLLSFLGGYFSSFENILRQREICKKILKSGKVPINHRDEVSLRWWPPCIYYLTNYVL